MENALWKGKRLVAYEVSKDYFTEKEIRRASHKGELCCPDPGCKSSILKYCHGEIKQPYFAHRDESDCDYVKYEKASGVFRGLRLLLCEHFSACDYPVQMEAKVLAHHYSHLYFEWEDGTKTAIELGTKRTNIHEVEKLNQEYQDNQVVPIWLVVDHNDKHLDERHTYFLKRYCLNESANRSLLTLTYDGKKVVQYKKVPAVHCKTEIGDYLVESQTMFVYEGTCQDLVFENGALTLKGFGETYENLLAYRQSKAEKFRQELLERQRLAKEQEEQRRLEERNMEAYRKEKAAEQQRYLEWMKAQAAKEFDSEYMKRKDSILPMIEQQERQVRDEAGVRWIRCEICGEVKEEAEFVSYGGRGRLNIGKCKSCMK